jgi:ubiquinone biosynthesis protein
MDVIGENLRLQQIYATLGAFTAELVLDDTALAAPRRRMQRWVHNLPEPVPDYSTATRTRILLEGLGPTYVKMGQIVSSQVNVLPDEWRIELDRLQNEVPTFPYPMVQEIIRRELGAPIEELYAEFSPTPLAAASLAQVHRARLHDGQEVAVKVQRPNLEKQVKADLGVAHTAGRAFEARSQWAREIGLRGMLGEFSTNLVEELDYYGEAYNMMRLTENMTDLPGVKVPGLYRELSAKRVLTQEFIVGVKISDLEAIDAAGIDRGVLGTNALRAAIKMLLVDGFFHADPHPGNLYVDLQTGNVTFLDCGMVGELTVMQRINLVALLWTVVNGDMTAMASQLRSLSEPFRPVDEANFVRTFERRMARYGKGSGADFDDVFNAGMAVLRDAGLRLDPALTLAMKAMMQASAFFTPLAPQGQSFSDAALNLALEQAQAPSTEAMVKDLAAKEAKQAAVRAAHAAPEYIKSLIGWNEQFKKGKFTVTVDTSQLDGQMEQVRSITSMVVVALLVSGAIIGTAIGATAFAGGELERYASIAFFASLTIGAVLLVLYIGRLFRKRPPGV